MIVYRSCVVEKIFKLVAMRKNWLSMGKAADISEKMCLSRRGYDAKHRWENTVVYFWNGTLERKEGISKIKRPFHSVGCGETVFLSYI